ncbi:hypothetical protein Lal_00021299 [Lupinus albus]|nr:hypothetical protein Lal_00021299 [Lupinus albus]
MAEHRPKRMNTIANWPRRTFETGGPSSATPSRPARKRDPYFTPELQASRLECFQFPHELEVQGTNTFIRLDEIGSLTVENRLLHYVIAYMLVQRNTNHAQPKTNDLKMIFAIKQGKLVNWPTKILKVMSGIATSSSRLLAYEIFISRVIDHMEIDTLDVEIKLTNTHDHQLGEYLIHKMGIYKITSTWMYQEDYRTTVDLDLSDEETPVAQQEQPTAPPEVPEASQAPPFGLAHLDALKIKLRGSYPHKPNSPHAQNEGEIKLKGSCAKLLTNFDRCNHNINPS